MKLATVLAATASANVSSYIAEHWWNEVKLIFFVNFYKISKFYFFFEIYFEILKAVNVFNFANSNWDQFAAAANSVSFDLF